MNFANLSDSELDSMVAKKFSAPRMPANESDYANLSDSELDNLISQKISNQAPQSSQDLPEADLGFVNRARYALEPIESNRIALLQEKFGKENVVNQNGEIYLNQNGYLRPVNKSGLSTADFADIAGALPETIPTAIGTMAGGLGGAMVAAPTAGTSIPGGIATGRAIGGGLGSLFRQGLSTAIGNPQVASMPERAIETAMSSAGSVLGGKVVDTVAPYLSKAPLIKNFFGSKASAPIAQEAQQLATQSGEDILQEVPREAVTQQMQKLKDIALRQGLPEPTYAQAAGGKAILAEANLIDTPLIGGKVRSQVDQQLKAVKKNLEQVAGKFIDAESTAFEVGLATKEIAQANEQVQKKMAQELYQKVDELGSSASIGKNVFFNKYRDFAGKLGLINPDLKPAKYAADTGLTRNEFNVLQSALFDGLDAIKKTKSPKIKFDSVNALRKTLNATSEELIDNNPNAARILNEFVKDINDTAERTLSREAPKLGEVFKEANKNYAIFKDYQQFNKKIFTEGMGEEKVVKKLMSDSAKIEKLKEVIGEGRVKEVGVSYVKDILEPLSKSGVARADSALSAIKKNSAPIKASIGEEAYQKLVENLYYLNRTNQPLNISRTSLYNLFDDSKGGLKGAAARIINAGSSYATSKGVSAGDIAKKAVSPITEPYSATLGKGMTPGTVGNLLSTPIRPDIQMTNQGGTFIKYGQNKNKVKREPGQK